MPGAHRLFGGPAWLDKGAVVSSCGCFTQAAPQQGRPGAWCCSTVSLPLLRSLCGFRDGTKLACRLTSMNHFRTTPLFFWALHPWNQWRTGSKLYCPRVFHSARKQERLFSVEFGRTDISSSRHLNLIYSLLLQVTTNKRKASLNSWARVLFLDVMGTSKRKRRLIHCYLSSNLLQGISGLFRPNLPNWFDVLI